MSSQIWSIPTNQWAESKLDRYEMALRGVNRTYQPGVTE